MKINDISNKINKTSSSIYRFCRENNLPMSTSLKLKLFSQKEYDSNNNTGHFLSGLIAGEGCFSWSLSNNKKRFVFSCELTCNDSNILQTLKEYIGCGHLYKDLRKEKRENCKPTTRYVVNRIIDIYINIIPFFDTYSLRNTLKREQYLRWKMNFLNQYQI